MEFFPSFFSYPFSPSFFLHLSGMPLSLLGETQSLLAFEVKVVHNRLIVQWAWLNYGLQMVGTILVVVDEQGFLLDICGRPAGH